MTRKVMFNFSHLLPREGRRQVYTPPSTLSAAVERELGGATPSSRVTVDSAHARNPKKNGLIAALRRRLSGGGLPPANLAERAREMAAAQPKVRRRQLIDFSHLIGS